MCSTIKSITLTLDNYDSELYNVSILPQIIKFEFITLNLLFRICKICLNTGLLTNNYELHLFFCLEAIRDHQTGIQWANLLWNKELRIISQDVVLLVGCHVRID